MLDLFGGYFLSTSSLAELTSICGMFTVSIFSPGAVKETIKPSHKLFEVNTN